MAKHITWKSIKEGWKEFKRKVEALEKPSVNVHSGFSPNMWAEQDPKDKAKNLLKRF